MEKDRKIITNIVWTFMFSIVTGLFFRFVLKETWTQSIRMVLYLIVGILFFKLCALIWMKIIESIINWNKKRIGGK